MQWSAASKKGPLYMPLKAFRLIENGRCPEATAEQALRVDRPPLVFSYTTSSASLPLKGRVKPTLNQENVNSVTKMRSQGYRSSERSEPGCLLSCLQKSEEDYVGKSFICS